MKIEFPEVVAGFLLLYLIITVAVAAVALQMVAERIAEGWNAENYDRDEEEWEATFHPAHTLAIIGGIARRARYL
jgi:hypothetical protein